MIKNKYTYLSFLNRTAFIDDEKVNSKINFLDKSSYINNVLSENFGCEPPDTIAIILVLRNISHCATLPIKSTSAEITKIYKTKIQNIFILP